MKLKCPNCQKEFHAYIKNRSVRENNYYWGVVLETLAETTGFTPQEAHDAMRWKFLRKGNQIETVQSTKNLTVAEFENYLTQIRTFASQELNCFIPLPNENI